MKDVEEIIEIFRFLTYRRPVCINCRRYIEVMDEVDGRFKEDITTPVMVSARPVSTKFDSDCGTCPFENELEKM